MHLVDEQHRLRAGLAERALGLVDDLPHVLDAGRHRRQLAEAAPRRAGDEHGERRLAGAGRSPQHHRQRRVALDEPAQRRAAGEQVALADDLVEGARAHPHREGRDPLGRLLLGGVEQRVPGHAATLRRPRARAAGVGRTTCTPSPPTCPPAPTRRRPRPAAAPAVLARVVLPVDGDRAAAVRRRRGARHADGRAGARPAPGARAGRDAGQLRHLVRGLPGRLVGARRPTCARCGWTSSCAGRAGSSCSPPTPPGGSRPLPGRTAPLADAARRLGVVRRRRRRRRRGARARRSGWPTPPWPRPGDDDAGGHDLRPAGVGARAAAPARRGARGPRRRRRGRRRRPGHPAPRRRARLRRGARPPRRPAARGRAGQPRRLGRLRARHARDAAGRPEPVRRAARRRRRARARVAAARARLRRALPHARRW